MSYPPAGGYWPQPPRKSRTGLIVGVSAAVVVIALAVVLVVVLTGRDDSQAEEHDAPRSGAPDTSATEPDPGGGTGFAAPADLVDAFATFIEGGDLAAVGDYTCDDATADAVGEVLAPYADAGPDVRIIDVTDGDFAVASIQVKTASDTKYLGFTLESGDNGWCVSGSVA